jgi:UDP-N-acetyl-2-amino-2-deoxyglucuronate dehydrogenase
MSEPFGFGIIGAGVISAWHAAGIEAHPDGRVVAVASRSIERAEKFAAEHRCAVMNNWHELIKRADIKAVCICSPSGLHEKQSIAAACAGKHVLVEKPMAITLKGCDEMIAAARDNNVKLGVIFQKRTEEAPNRLKKGVQDGVFGKIFFGDSSIKNWRNQAYYDSADWRGTWALDGGGCTMNQGIHGIDLLLYIMGEVESIFAKTATVAHAIEVEDIAIALLKYKNGAFGRLQTATAVNPGQGIYIEVNGTLGTASISDDAITGWAVSDSKEKLAFETIPEITAKEIGGASSPTNISARGHIIQIANFISAVRTGENLICSGEEGQRSVHLIMALYESARRGEEVRLEEIKH